MIKKKCKECGTLIDPHAQDYCDICHGNHGWWYTCDKHEDIIFREEKKECPVCRLLARIAEAAQPEPTTAKAPDISIHIATMTGNIEAVKQHIAAGTDVNANESGAGTPLDWANDKETTDLLRKHGGKTGAELKAEAK